MWKKEINTLASVLIGGLENLIFVLDISQPDPYTYLLTLICLVFTLIFQNSEISHNTNLYVNTWHRNMSVEIYEIIINVHLNVLDPQYSSEVN